MDSVSVMDTIMHWISLVIPVCFLFIGIMAIGMAVIGSPKWYENSKNPQIRQMVEVNGKTKVRLLHFFLGIFPLAFGGWLLYCWIFGPVRR